MTGRTPALPAGLPPLRRIFPGGQTPVENIVGRDGDITRLWSLLLAGSCLLNEPRRIGKSSLLIRMKHGTKPPGWEFIHTSVQGVKSTDEFAAHVLIEIHKHQGLSDLLKGTVRSFLADAELEAGVAGSGLKLRGAFAQSPLQALESALAGVARHLADDDRYLAIAWDEFPDMVVSVIANEGEAKAGALLGVLRRFREQNPDRIRWVLTGSVGLHHALRQLSSSGEQYVTDLQSVPLGPLTEDWARWLAGSLLLGVGCQFDDSALGALAGTTDGIPYLLHLLAAWARDHGPCDVGAGDVAGLFTAAIGDLDASHQSTHVLSRLGDYYGEDARLAEWILDRLAAEPSTRSELVAGASAFDPRPNAETLRRLVDLLNRDHYLTIDAAGRHAWRYDALRRIWVQRRSS